MSNKQPISTFLGIAAAVVLVSSSYAAIINVPGDFGTIQAAIAHPGTVAGDEIVVAPGTYPEAIDFLGKAITVRSSGGAAVTTIDGGGVEFHVVQCVSGEGPDTVLDGFTITGGNANGAFPDNVGGGMTIRSSSPTVTNCTFSGNSAGFAGGMANSASSPAVTNCTFSANMVSNNGGGMFNAAGSDPTVTNCMFSGNMAGIDGGGMQNGNSSPTVTNCSFIGNTAGSSGGGMVNNFNGSPTVTNCTFSGNSAGDDGGGMNNTSSSPTVTNCTFSDNTAGDEGGAMRNSVSSTPTVTNCILWGDTPDEIVGGMPVVSYSNVQGGFPGTGNIVGGADPMFVDEPGGDLRLSAGSPAIDAADSDAPGLAGITEDLDGNPRFVDDPCTVDTGNPVGEVIVDMGAYEFQPPCPTDINCDGVTNVLDLIDLLLCFGLPAVPGCESEDVNGDGTVNVLDLIDVLLEFGQPCP